jgi:citrate synthase
MMTAIMSKLVEKAMRNNLIDDDAYAKNHVMRGLRHPNGTGVLVGLTDVGAVEGYVLVDNVKVASEGKLYYRGIDLEALVQGFQQEERRGYEETAYLLLFGELPNAEELEQFKTLLDEERQLPPAFTENMILKNPSKDIMNKLQRSVLVLYSFDDRPDDTDVENLIRQSIRLIAQFPTIIAYGYQAKAHYFKGESLVIHPPKRGVGTAENILHMIRADSQYTQTEAEVLDLCLVIHAEHGGGNNSAFATHVVSSSGTDTYSVITTALGSLKGPKHGGASSKVKAMADDIIANCTNWKDEATLKNYLRRMLAKEVFDASGLIYGMGHAVYTISDPRVKILKEKAYQLAMEKSAMDVYQLYEAIERLGGELLNEKRGDRAMICANVDLYSGFVYSLLKIPEDLFTPLFAAARISGWCAHRIEQIVSDPKIMRPAYISIGDERPYIGLAERG